MRASKRALVLGMRVASEEARMADLKRLLPFAAAGDAASRGPELTARIDARAAWAARRPMAADGLTDLYEEATDADVLIDELMALAMTRLLRAQGLDNGTFAAAEALLRQLSDTAGISPLVLGHTPELESINHTRATVAIRFPGSRVWDLPFLAHEFGHHAIAQLRHIEREFPDKRPLDDVVTATAIARDPGAETPSQSRNRANEMVADAFATVVCGPSYPIACLALRVPPGTAAGSPKDGHPAWSERIAVMCASLDCMTEKTGLARYSSQRSEVVEPLVREVLEPAPALTLAAEHAAGGTVAAIVRHRPGLLFRDADQGIAVASALRERRTAPPPGTTVTAVLDGAWRWMLRRTDTREDAEVSTLVAEYCRTISSGGT